MTHECIPKTALDVIDCRSVLTALSEIREGDCELLECPLGPCLVTSGHD